MEEKLPRRNLENKILLAKIELRILKIIPMLLAGCYLANTTLFYFGISLDFLSYIGGISLLPLLFLYLASYRCGFCAYHRMFLHYIAVNNIFTLIDYYIGIPINNFHIFLLYIILTGLFLFIILYLKFKAYEPVCYSC